MNKDRKFDGNNRQMSPVLILGDYSNTSLSTIRALANTEFPLYAVDVTNKRNFSLWSRYLKDYFLIKSWDFEELLRIVNYLSGKHRCRCVIFPVTEAAALLVDKVKHVLVKNHVVFCSRNISYEVLIDKRSMVQLAVKAGFNVPETIIDLKQTDKIKFPTIIKTSNNLKGKRYHILTSEADLKKVDFKQYDKSDNLLVQQFILGKEFVVSACRLKDGTSIIGSVCQKIESWPSGKGESTIICSRWMEGISSNVSTLLELSDWYGIVDIDFIFDESSKKMYFIEVNYRVGAGFIIGIVGGINLPRILIKDAFDLPYKLKERIPDNIYLVQDGLFFNHLKTINIKRIAKFISLLKRADIYTIYDSKDVIPFIILWKDRILSNFFKLFNLKLVLKKIGFLKETTSNYFRMEMATNVFKTTDSSGFCKMNRPSYWNKSARRNVNNVFVSSDVYSSFDQRNENALIKSEKRKAVFLLNHLKTKKKAKILDVGCGCGDFYFLVPKSYYVHYTGIDFSSEMIERFKRRLSKEEQRNITLIESEFLSFNSNNKFDFLIAIGTFQYIGDLNTVLAKCSNVMKKGGLLIFDFWNSNHFRDRLGFKPTHPRNWKLSDVEGLLQKHGFCIKELISYENRTGFLNRFVCLSSYIDYWLQDHSIYSYKYIVNNFGRRITIVAQKMD
ncbi:MAG: methyltransferase domain-containing protein [Bacteroidales bacterium]|nr:methyltransferase domain-containing protein [Bacteroidales bacterium]